MTESSAFGRVTNRASLGRGTSSVCPSMAESCSFFYVTNRTVLGSGTGSVYPRVTERIAFGFVTDRTGLGSGTGSADPIVTERIAFGCFTNVTSFGSCAGCLTPIVLYQLDGKRFFFSASFALTCFFASGCTGRSLAYCPFTPLVRMVGKHSARSKRNDAKNDHQGAKNAS